MVQVHYIFTCDQCGKENPEDIPCSILWGVEWMRPVLSLGWQLIQEGSGIGGKLLCDQHHVEVTTRGTVGE